MIETKLNRKERLCLPVKKTMRKTLLWLMVLALLLLGAYWFLLRSAHVEYTEETARTQDIHTYYTFSGNLEPDDAKVFYATSRINVKELLLEEGDTVKDGDAVLTTSGGTRIKADFDGTISDIYAEQDVTYNPGEPLFRVADYDHPKIIIQVDEYDIAALKKGMAVDIKVQATEEKLTGEIVRIAREATVAGDIAYYQAEIAVNAEGMQIMGLTCEISIPRDSVDDATTLPVKAIQYDDDGKPFVYIYDRHDEVMEQSVTLGVTDGTIVEIKDGVRSGETVLIPPAGMEEFMRQMMQRHNR